jgi:hypothetical protein
MNRLPRTLSSIEELRLVAGLVVQPFLAAGLAFVILLLFPCRPGSSVRSTSRAASVVGLSYVGMCRPRS